MFQRMGDLAREKRGMRRSIDLRLLLYIVPVFCVLGILSLRVHGQDGEPVKIVVDVKDLPDDAKGPSGKVRVKYGNGERINNSLSRIGISTISRKKEYSDIKVGGKTILIEFEDGEGHIFPYNSEVPQKSYDAADPDALTYVFKEYEVIGADPTEKLNVWQVKSDAKELRLKASFQGLKYYDKSDQTLVKDAYGFVHLKLSPDLMPACKVKLEITKNDPETGLATVTNVELEPGWDKVKPVVFEAGSSVKVTIEEVAATKYEYQGLMINGKSLAGLGKEHTIDASDLSVDKLRELGYRLEIAPGFKSLEAKDIPFELDAKAPINLGRTKSTLTVKYDGKEYKYTGSVGQEDPENVTVKQGSNLEFVITPGSVTTGSDQWSSWVKSLSVNGVPVKSWSESEGKIAQTVQYTVPETAERVSVSVEMGGGPGSSAVTVPFKVNVDPADGQVIVKLKQGTKEQEWKTGGGEKRVSVGELLEMEIIPQKGWSCFWSAGGGMSGVGSEEDKISFTDNKSITKLKVPEDGDLDHGRRYVIRYTIVDESTPTLTIKLDKSVTLNGSASPMPYPGGKLIVDLKDYGTVAEYPGDEGVEVQVPTNRKLYFRVPVEDISEGVKIKRYTLNGSVVTEQAKLDELKYEGSGGGLEHKPNSDVSFALEFDRGTGMTVKPTFTCDGVAVPEGVYGSLTLELAGKKYGVDAMGNPLVSGVSLPTLYAGEEVTVVVASGNATRLKKLTVNGKEETIAEGSEKHTWVFSVNAEMLGKDFPIAVEFVKRNEVPLTVSVKPTDNNWGSVKIEADLKGRTVRTEETVDTDNPLQAGTKVLGYEKIKLTFEPKPGYLIDRFKVNGEEKLVGIGGVYVYEVPQDAAKVDIEVEFVKPAMGSVTVAYKPEAAKSKGKVNLIEYGTDKTQVKKHVLSAAAASVEVGGGNYVSVELESAPGFLPKGFEVVGAAKEEVELTAGGEGASGEKVTWYRIPVSGGAVTVNAEYEKTIPLSLVIRSEGEGLKDVGRVSILDGNRPLYTYSKDTEAGKPNAGNEKTWFRKDQEVTVEAALNDMNQKMYQLKSLKVNGVDVEGVRGKVKGSYTFKVTEGMVGGAESVAERIEVEAVFSLLPPVPIRVDFGNETNAVTLVVTSASDASKTATFVNGQTQPEFSLMRKGEFIITGTPELDKGLEITSVDGAQFSGIPSREWKYQILEDAHEVVIKAKLTGRAEPPAGSGVPVRVTFAGGVLGGTVEITPAGGKAVSVSVDGEVEGLSLKGGSEFTVKPVAKKGYEVSGVTAEGVEELGKGEMYRYRVKGDAKAVALTVSFVNKGGETAVAENRMTVRVWPNPAVGDVQVASSGVLTSIRVLNLLGRVVRSVEGVRVTDYRVDLGGLPSGVYLLQLVGEDGGVQVKRVVVR